MNILGERKQEKYFKLNSLDQNSYNVFVFYCFCLKKLKTCIISFILRFKLNIYFSTNKTIKKTRNFLSCQIILIEVTEII
jgi:hypothetical protein